MTIPPDLAAQILRLHHAEKWPPGTIADQLGVHHSVVRRVLEQEGVPTAAITRSSRADPFVPFIVATLEKYPRLTASRLYQMVKERGYDGRPDHFRSIVARYRPAPPVEAYLRLKTAPGDQAQVDWGHFGKITVGQARRPLFAFVIVLSYSRAIFLRFFPGQQMSYFLAGHQAAFARWNGVPRTLLYDNLKSVVIERVGDAIRFNDQIHAFAGHYRYEPRPVAPYRGNEKGRVERAIRYVRDNFFPARTFDSLEDINEQADRWCDTFSLDRPWPEDRNLTVRDAYDRERSTLRPLPATDFPCHERKEVRVGKTPYLRFDRNDYSVPHTFARKLVIVVADLDTVRVLDRSQRVIATHPRSFDAGRQIEDERHIQALKEAKGHARKGRQTDRLSHLAPSSTELIRALAERHRALGRHVADLELLLVSYGAERLEAAIREALEKGTPHPQAVRHILEREQEARGEKAALPLPLPDDPRIHGMRVRTHDLRDYDRLDEDPTPDDSEE